MMAGFATLGSFYGADTLELQRMFAGLPGNVQARVLKPLMEKASKIVVAEERSEAPKESGLLQTSLGVSTTRTYNAGGGSSKIFIAVGVRRGYRRAVTASKRGRLRYRGKKFTEENPETAVRNPSRYLHLVIKGRKAVTASGRALYSSLTGRFFGKSVAAAAPNPFIERAFEGSQAAVLASLQGSAGPAIEAEAAKLGNKR